MRKLTLSITLATLATAGVAVAAPSMGDGRTPQADITRAQVEAKAAAHFARLDANGDGKLDQADRAAMRARMFDRIDANKDGAISREEFAATHRGGEEARAGQRGNRQGMAGHLMGGGKMGGMHGRRMGGAMMAKLADANKDGAITHAEFTAAALKHFDTGDANRDGTLTQAERQAARAQMKAKWEARKAERRAQ